jgi:hypothetical protein
MPIGDTSRLYHVRVFIFLCGDVGFFDGPSGLLRHEPRRNSCRPFPQPAANTFEQMNHVEGLRELQEFVQVPKGPRAPPPIEIAGVRRSGYGHDRDAPAAEDDVAIRVRRAGQRRRDQRPVEADGLGRLIDHRARGGIPRPRLAGGSAAAIDFAVNPWTIPEI